MIRRRWALDVPDALVLAVAVSLPWLFGGVSSWARRGAGALLLLALSASLARWGWSALPRLQGPFLPAAMIVLWCFLQCVPLPDVVVSWMSPTAAQWRSAAESAVGAGADVAGAWHPLSASWGSTLEAGVWWTALFAAAAVVVRRAADPTRASRYRAVLFATFVALAAFGLFQYATWNGRIYWFRESPGRAFGPYANGTNFAGAMELATPWIAGYAWGRARSVRGRSGGKLGVALGFGAAVLCGVAGLAAQSKMGAVLIIVSLTALVLAGTPTGETRRRNVWIAVSLWGLLAAAALVGPLAGRAREAAVSLGSGPESWDRILAWESSLGILRDFWLTGSGFGTFAVVFPRYVPAGSAKVFLQAHNDYLEFLITGGVVGGALLAWFVVASWIRVRRAGHDPRRPGERTARLGLLLGVLSLAVHATVDFNHQIPANALLFTIAWSLLCARTEGGEDG